MSWASFKSPACPAAIGSNTAIGLFSLLLRNARPICNLLVNQLGCKLIESSRDDGERGKRQATIRFKIKVKDIFTTINKYQRGKDPRKGDNF